MFCNSGNENTNKLTIVVATLDLTEIKKLWTQRGMK